MMTLALLALTIGGAQGPFVPPPIPGMAHNDDYTVRVRAPGGVWQDLFEHVVTVDLDAPQRASMVQFDMDSPVEVEVRRNNRDVRRVHVRPDRTGIRAQVTDGIARFTLQHPAKISGEFDGDRLHNLHLFARARGTNVPKRTDPHAIWFGPGIHRPLDPPGAVFFFPSDSIVYLVPRAVLRGKIVLDRVSNVQIRGRGNIDQAERCFEVIYPRNVTIDGPTIINPRHYTIFCGQWQGLKVRDLATR